MLKRLIVGMFLGLAVGAAMAALLVKGLGVLTFAGGPGTLLAYAAAAATGVVTGLIAGKPIWSPGGKLEAGLKAFFGALLAAAAMFAARRWLMMPLDLSALGAGAAAAGELPAIALPAIALVLGALFELDNTPSTAGDKARVAPLPSAKVRVAGGKVEAQEEGAEGADEGASASARRR